MSLRLTEAHGADLGCNMCTAVLCHLMIRAGSSGSFRETWVNQRLLVGLTLDDDDDDKFVRREVVSSYEV